MARVTPQPLLCVRDVPRSSRWYQQVLGAESGHGGEEYERIVVDDVLVLQLHEAEQEHHHGGLVDTRQVFGNGVAVWFEVDDLDAARKRVVTSPMTVTIQTDTHVNPNAGHRELWLRDPDGYLVVLAGA